jgi:hypothetical protein
VTTSEAKQFVEVEQEPHHQTVLANDAVRVFWVEIGEGDVSLMHRHHYDYVTVVIGDSIIGNCKLGEQEQREMLAHGDVFYSSGGLAHQVRNAGDQPFRNFAISILREGQTGASSMVARLLQSGVRAEQKLNEPHVSVAKMTLKNQEVKLVGEGLLIPLANGAVDVNGNAGVLRLAKIGDFAWVSGVTRVRCEGESELVVMEVR